MALQARLLKEVRDVQRDTHGSGVSASLVGESMTHMKGRIEGPPDSPYEGGVFVVDIQIPGEYPFEPPKMQFDTRIWHPNMCVAARGPAREPIRSSTPAHPPPRRRSSSQTGAICLDILKDQWSPALTVKTALMSVRALLTAAEPDDPQDAEVARQYKTDPAQFAVTAQHWTATYAMDVGEEQKVGRLTAMGFDAGAVRAALASLAGDESQALEQLLASA